MFGHRYYGARYFAPRYFGDGGDVVAPPVFNPGSGGIADITETENTGLHAYDLSTKFTGATSYSIDPAVETGWTFATDTALLTIDTDDVGVFGPYIVTGTNESGSDDSNAFSVSVVAAEQSEEAPTGGWLFLNLYEAEQQRRRAREKARKQLEDETEQIEDELDRAIAVELRKQERLDDKRKDLDRLAEIAKANADLEAARQYSERVATAYARALEKGTFSALEALDRELKRAKEEEEFLVAALFMLAD